MSITILAFASATLIAASAPGTVSHSLPIEHNGNNFTATYMARPVISMREIGLSPGSRAGSLRCTWTADVNVKRTIAAPAGSNGAPAVRTLAPVKRISGSVPGGCSGSRDRVDREIAARAPAITRHVELVADQDRRALLGELENLTGLSAG